MAERAEISIHEVIVFNAFRNNPERWLTHKDVETMAAGRVKARTVREHTRRLVNLGILDQLEVFPQHRYRFSQKSEKRNLSYMKRLQAVIDALGSEIDTVK